MLLSSFISLLPYYFVLVVIPGIVDQLVIRHVLRLEMREILSLSDLQTFVTDVLIAPVTEEVVFRAIPYILGGQIGLAIGDVCWIGAHFGWRAALATSRFGRAVVLASSAMFYTCAAIFYSLALIKAGLVICIIYHILHNFSVFIGDFLARSIKIRRPIKRRRKERRYVYELEL